MSKIRILLEDDTEILGNGLGHVMARQYLPVQHYLKLLLNLNICSTFYVDIAHYMFLVENKNIGDNKLQSGLIEELIIKLLENKMDVQLHLHSQWVNAKLYNGYGIPTDVWNIGRLNQRDQADLIYNGIEHLNQIIKNAGFQHKICSFKAGSWGLQPFNSLAKIFKEKNIGLILGPVKGLKLKTQGVDYSTMEESYLPYYCQDTDICRIGSSKNNLISVPITPTYLNWVDVARYSLFQIYKKLEKHFDKAIDIDQDFPVDQLNKPLQDEKINIRFSGKPIETHLKINSQPFWYLKNTFKRSIKKIEQQNLNYPLITIETHTKDFKNNFKDIKEFFKHIKTEYTNIEFITITKLLKDIENGLCVPKSK